MINLESEELEREQRKVRIYVDKDIEFTVEIKSNY